MSLNLSIQQNEKDFVEQQLVDIDTIEEVLYNIGIYKPIEKKRDEYKNVDIIKHLRELEELCPFYNGIRGDGNCFYRAMMYQYLLVSFITKRYDTIEEIINNLTQNKIEFKNIILDTIPNQFQNLYQNKDLFKKTLILNLKYLNNLRITQSNQQFHETLSKHIRINHHFDFTLVVYLREFAIKMFDENEMIPFMYEEETQREAERNRLQTYGEEAQNSNLDMSYNALKVNVFTHQVDKIRYTCMESGTDQAIFSIDLFFRPGHYDCTFREDFITL